MKGNIRSGALRTQSYHLLVPPSAPKWHPAQPHGPKLGPYGVSCGITGTQKGPSAPKWLPKGSKWPPKEAQSGPKWSPKGIQNFLTIVKKFWEAKGFQKGGFGEAKGSKKASQNIYIHLKYFQKACFRAYFWCRHGAQVGPKLKLWELPFA